MGITTGTRRLALLTPADLPGLPTCADCSAAELFAADASWARAAMEQFGFCGVAAENEGRPVAHLVLCPSLTIPTGHPLTNGARAPRGAGLLELWVDPSYARAGLGRQLVQHATARLVDKATCIEAIGALTDATCCAPPRAWLEQLGFAGTGVTTLQGERMRLDLERTVSWRETWRGAAHRVNAWLSQPSTEPSNRDAWLAQTSGPSK